MDIIIVNLKLKLLNLDNYKLKTKGSKATLMQRLLIKVIYYC